VAGAGRVKLAAIVLAAGRSARFGADKRLAELRGKPLIAHVFNALDSFDFAQKIAVLRPDDPIEALVRRHGVMPVVNPRAGEGMGTSLACGVAALDAVDGAFIVLADMPDIPGAIFATLAGRLRDANIVVPRHGGRDGHPVLFGATCFDALKTLDGDRGGRAVIDSGRYRVARLDGVDRGILRDIDRLADL